jgi:hypothetical protein
MEAEELALFLGCDLDRNEEPMAYSDSDAEMLAGADSTEDGCEVRDLSLVGAVGKPSRENRMSDYTELGRCTRA